MFKDVLMDSDLYRWITYREVFVLFLVKERPG